MTPQDEFVTLIAILEAVSPRKVLTPSPISEAFVCNLGIVRTSRKIGMDQIFTSPLADPDRTQ